MIGPYRAASFGEGVMAEWGVKGPTGEEHSPTWSKKDAQAMAERCNRVHAAAVRTARERVQNEIAELSFARDLATAGVSRLVREREELRAKVEVMRAKVEQEGTEAGPDLPLTMHNRAGQETAFGEVLALLPEPAEEAAQDRERLDQFVRLVDDEPVEPRT